MGLGLGQGEPVEIAGGSRNTVQTRRETNAAAGRTPSDEQDRIRYGIITKVNENSFVKIRLLNNAGEPVGSDIVDGAFLPLITPLSQIFMLWGSLRKGLLCRVFWRGKLEPNASSAIEVIADEHHNFLKKEIQSNEIATNPYKLMSGGLG